MVPFLMKPQTSTIVTEVSSKQMDPLSIAVAVGRIKSVLLALLSRVVLRRAEV